MAVQQTERRLNILLPPKTGSEFPIPPPGGNGVWSEAAMTEARRTIARMDDQHIPRQEFDADTVQRVLDAVYGHPQVAGMMAAAGIDTQAGSGGQGGGRTGYVTLSDVSGVGPPEDAPFVIPEIGLISIPAPPEAAQHATEAAQSVVPGAVVQPSVTMRAISTLLNEEQHELASLGLPIDRLTEGDETEQPWLEAALQENAAAEIVPWGISRVKAPALWARGFFGQGVRVAVVDTGIGPHIDLPAPVAGATFVPGTLSFADDNGHGTHVSGTIAARKNGQGVVGVAPRATLMAAKVLDQNGSGSDTWVAAGIVWAVNHGADVINMSLGGSFSAAIHSAVLFARSRKVTICAAAGNNGCPAPGGNTIGYPGSDPLVICVAATDAANNHASFSSCGPALDVAAPGANILSTYLHNSYRVLNGTSMATPHVTGVVALLLSRIPHLNPTRVQRRLQGNALALGSHNLFGSGLVQADRAILAPRPGTTATERAGDQGDGISSEDQAEIVTRPTSTEHHQRTPVGAER